MKSIEKRLKKLLISYGIDKSKINDNSDYYFDLNLDMLDLMDLAGVIKKEFSVNIPEKEIYRMEKVSDTIFYLKKRKLEISNFYSKAN